MSLAALRPCALAVAAALCTAAALPSLARADAQLAAAPGSWDAGFAELGTGGPSVTVRIVNAGDAAAVLNPASLSGPDAGSFLIEADGCAGGSLDPGSECTVDIRFRPIGSAGAKSASVSVDAPGILAAGAALSGTAQAREITFTAASPFTYADTTVGAATQAQLDLRNSSDLPVSLSSIAVGGPDASDFTLDGNGCPGQLWPGSSCSVWVSFRPSHSGAAAAALAVVSDAQTSPLILDLAGAGVPAQLSLQPSPLDFGLAEINRGDPSQQVSVQNTGPAPALIGGPSIDGPGASGYSIDWSGCQGQTLSPGASCYVQVRFSPRSPVAYDATLHVPAGGQDFSAALAGTGGLRAASADPAAPDFGAVAVGASADRTVTLRSTGNLPYQAIVVLPTGGEVGAYRVIRDGCSARQVAPGESCALTVRFAPLAAGPAGATLNVIQGDGEPTPIALRGEGLQALAAIAPGGADFDRQAPGTAGPARTFSVANAGTAPLRVGAVALGGEAAGQFRVSGETCTAAPVAPGAACSVRVRFAPDADGLHLAALRIVADGAPVATAALTGTGDAAAGPAGRPDSAGVAFDWRAGVPAPYRGGRIDLGTLRCTATAACTVAIRAQLRIAGARTRTVVRTARWTPGRGRAVSLALPRRFAGTPVLLALRLRTTAAGFAAGDRTVRIPLIAGRRLGRLVVATPPARQRGPSILLGTLWCARGATACSATVSAAERTRRRARGPALATVRARVPLGGSIRLTMRRPAGLRDRAVRAVATVRAGGRALQAPVRLAAG